MMGKKLVWVLLLMVAISACNISTNEQSVDGSTSTSDNWQSVAVGVDYRTLAAAPSNAATFDMHIVRIDPTRVDFRVHYQAGRTHTYTTWKEDLGTEAIAFVNANLFDENNLALGMVIADGVLYGTTFVGYGGMFAIDGNSAPSLTSLSLTPHQGAGYSQAVQGFPMLVYPGGTAAPTGPGFDEAARRTVIAQDSNGNVLLLSTGILGQISLRDLQTWLLDSGLNIDAAFALDGGRSSLLYVRADSAIEIPAFSAVPVILAVYER